MPEDINKYLAEREGQGLALAAIDREIDLLSQVITYAKKTERIHMEHSPLYGVIRPGHFNERDRRLVGAEETRLFAAAREEDRRLAIETALAPYREQAARMQCHDSTRKRFVRPARTHIEAAPAAVTVICETARRAGVPLNAFELASISGHRDLRSLARYLNLCTGELTQRLDEAHQIADTQSRAAQPHKETSPFNHEGRPRAYSNERRRSRARSAASAVCAHSRGQPR